MALLVNYPAYTNDSGNGQSGTALDASWLDQQKSSIEDQVHSTTNPTVRPRDVTDEVVAARGSMASLDARLDAALNEDGTPKPQAGVITGTQYQAGLGARNVLFNPQFDRWNIGPTGAPDGWVITPVVPVSIARAGAGESDITSFGAGQYVAKLMRSSGNDVAFTQTLVAAADFSNFTNMKGQKVSASIKAKATIANQIRIAFDDGSTQTFSSYHTGDGNEQHLTVTHTISNSAAKLDFRIEMKNADGNAYVGGCMVTFTQLAPSDWQPFSDQPVQTARILNTQYQAVQNAGTAETDLMTYTLPASTAVWNGRGLRITAWGICANTAGVKTIKGYFGATQVTAALAPAVSALQAWRIVIEILRIATGSQTISTVATSTQQNAATNPIAMQRVTAGTQVFTNPIVVKVTGQGGASGDVEQDGMIVELLN